MLIRKRVRVGILHHNEKMDVAQLFKAAVRARGNCERALRSQHASIVIVAPTYKYAKLPSTSLQTFPRQSECTKC